MAGSALSQLGNDPGRPALVNYMSDPASSWNHKKTTEGITPTGGKVPSSSGGDCDSGLLGSWQGTVTVTQGTDLVAAGLMTKLSCGDLVLSLSSMNGCSGCWLAGTYKGRQLAGCASGKAASLQQTDTGAAIQMTVAFAAGQFSVKITGDDSQKHSFGRTGVLTSCP